MWHRPEAIAKKRQNQNVKDHADAARKGEPSVAVLFNHFDDDGSGTLTTWELRRAMATLRIPGLGAKQLMAMMDGVGLGRIVASHHRSSASYQIR